MLPLDADDLSERLFITRWVRMVQSSLIVSILKYRKGHSPHETEHENEACIPETHEVHQKVPCRAFIVCRKDVVTFQVTAQTERGN